ncbi:hypothetical protein RJ640_003014 [Escallonia rubra]|uniref:Uncharacterized protein n=1 Tax=Escallonia rubra TaxID=112253 RepID=A0AA88RMQ2_9ASTE|nr:hypothetical protein RJ640_003014 [Escallonia rubra]
MEGRDINAPKLPAKKVAVALASLSAMVAETTTFPIDITKTRLQVIESPSTRWAGNIDRAVAVVTARWHRRDARRGTMKGHFGEGTGNEVRHTKVVLDVGYGDASFGGYVLDKDDFITL